MRAGCDGTHSEEAANYHTAPGALPRSLERASLQTKKRLITMLRSRDPTADGMQNMILLLQEPDIDAKVTAEVLQKLSEWLRRSAQVTQNLCLKFKIHGTLVIVFTRHALDIDVARAGLGAICACAVQSSENCSALARGGCLLQMYRMMEAHSRDRVVLDNASTALWKLAERGCARQICLTGGVRKLLTAMQENPSNPFLQSNGCTALQALLENGGAEEIEAMREAAVQALARHGNSIPIRRSTDKLLRCCELIVRRSGRQAQTKARPKAQMPAGGGRAAARGAVVADEASPLQPRLCAPQISLKDWLAEVDPKGELSFYHRELCQNFDSMAHLVDAYACDGSLAREFFEDLRISKVSHRRLIERWFEELLGRQEELGDEEPCPYQLPEDLQEAARAPRQPRRAGHLGPVQAPRASEGPQQSSPDDADDGRPKGWARALEILDNLDMRESLWERTLEHLELLQRRQARTAALSRDEGVVESSDDSDEEEELTRACFNAALKTCEEGWKWEESLALLEEMRRRLPPDESSYASAVGACSAERQWAPSLELLGRMRRAGASAKVLTYNAAIWSLEAEGAPWERALDILEEMSQLEATRQPSALTYTAAVNVFARHGQWRQALGVIDALRRRRLRPDVGTYRAIREVDWGCDWPVDDALDALDEIQRASRVRK